MSFPLHDIIPDLAVTPAVCHACESAIEVGAPVGCHTPTGTLWHAGCLQVLAGRAQHQHALAHELGELLLDIVDNFIEGKEMDDLSVGHALEMAASYQRRVLRDRGLPREEVKTMLAHASECAKGVYDERGQKTPAIDEVTNEEVTHRLVAENGLARGFASFQQRLTLHIEEA